MLMHSKYAAKEKRGINIVFVVLCISLICQKDSTNALIAFFYPSDKKYCFMQMFCCVKLGSTGIK